MKPKRKQRPEATQTLAEGPHDIQTRTIVAWDGSILRDAMAEPDEWRDPADNRDAQQARGRQPATVRGWRRTWCVRRLHRAAPGQITERHVDAAARFVSDVELRCGASPGARIAERIDAGGSDMPIVTRAVHAGIRLDRARDEIGHNNFWLVTWVAVDNMPISTVTERLHVRNETALARVYAALTALLDHYDGISAKPQHAAITAQSGA